MPLRPPAAVGRAVSASELQEVLAGRQTFADVSSAWFIQSGYVVSGSCRPHT
jgi:hypothetical protein